MIKEITEAEAMFIILGWEDGSKDNKGLFLIKNDDGTYSGIDNTSLDCWTEDFKSKAEATTWLIGEEN